MDVAQGMLQGVPEESMVVKMVLDGVWGCNYGGSAADMLVRTSEVERATKLMQYTKGGALGGSS